MSSTTYRHAEEPPGAAGAHLEARTALDAAHSCAASEAKPIFRVVAMDFAMLNFARTPPPSRVPRILKPAMPCSANSPLMRLTSDAVDQAGGVADRRSRSRNGRLPSSASRVGTATILQCR